MEMREKKTKGSLQIHSLQKKHKEIKGGINTTKKLRNDIKFVRRAYVQSLHCLFLAGASTARLLLRVGLAGGRLQVHVHHVLLLRRRESLHPRQRRGDLAEQRLHDHSVS